MVTDLLNAGAVPNDYQVGRHILNACVGAVTSSWYSPQREEKDKRGLEAIRIIAAAGAKWDLDKKGLADLRRTILDGESKTVIAMLDIFRSQGVLSAEQLEELTRTSAMKSLLAGFTRPKRDLFGYLPRPRPTIPVVVSQPVRTGYWKRHW